MAKKWTNKNIPGALHFVTGIVDKRRPIFHDPAIARALLEECQKHRTERTCKLIAFVVMPDHFHLIQNPRDGDIQTSTGTLKSFSAKSIVEIAQPGYFLDGEENQVWQESFKALPLWSGWMIWQKINYIHSNPIRARLVSATADYPWSSFHAFYGEQLDPLLQVDEDWWWPEDVEKLRKAMGESNQELEAEFELRRKRRLTTDQVVKDR